jgi:hypothetical protein
VVLAAGGKLEQGSAAGPLNGPSQWLWGEREAYTRTATLRHTLVGYCIHHCTSIFWAALHETVHPQSQPRTAVRHFANAGATAALAYFVDYHLTPRRLQPGFEKHVGSAAMFAGYAAFAGGLALCSWLRQRGWFR